MSEPVYRTVDKFDRAFGELHKLPDVTSVKPSTVVTLSPVLAEPQTFIVQTLRQKDVGDYIFIQYCASEGLVRLAIPPAAAEVIARQRDALTTKSRKRAARAEAQRRKAAGIKPAFLKKKTEPKPDGDK